jgi:two-component system, OmpR family, response regulator
MGTATTQGSNPSRTTRSKLVSIPKLKRIMVIEDDPHLLMITRIGLERVGGFEVNACNSGKEALSSLSAFHPDLVLLDVMMPGMDGIATLKALRGTPEAASVPVVFMTARAQKAEIETYLALGAAGVISKPFDPVTISETLLDLWQRQPAPKRKHRKPA